MKSLLPLVFIAASLAFGCSTNKPAREPGPAEKAGASIDEGAHDAKESAKDAGKKVGEETEKAGDKMQDKSGD